MGASAVFCFFFDAPSVSVIFLFGGMTRVVCVCVGVCSLCVPAGPTLSVLRANRKHKTQTQNTDTDPFPAPGADTSRDAPVHRAEARERGVQSEREEREREREKRAVHTTHQTLHGQQHNDTHQHQHPPHTHQQHSQRCQNTKSLTKTRSSPK